ncbi:MAG: glutamate 5-kinase, partial [Desulfovibrio sp.]|nr:glutamate 5-kinase [Desulfovibrio sp.]
MLESQIAIRTQALTSATTIIVKIGSAVLTDAQGLKRAHMQHLADQIQIVAKQRKNRRIILVTSAAVAAGRTILAKYSEKAGEQTLSAKQAIAAIGQCQLMQAWDQAFQKHKKPTAQVLLTRDDLKDRQRYLNIRNTFSELLSWQVLPIVNENDTVSVHELKFGDNDNLASLLVNVVNADLVVNLTSAEGVRAEDPAKNPEADVVSFIDDIFSLDIKKICGSKTLVGSGGMYSKLKAAQRTAQLGVPTIILPG